MVARDCRPWFVHFMEGTKAHAALVTPRLDRVLSVRAVPNPRDATQRWRRRV